MCFSKNSKIVPLRFTLLQIFLNSKNFGFRTSLKPMKDKEINTEPLYYPKWPQSVIDPEAVASASEDPNPLLAPLQAPWPLLLPPLQQPRGASKLRKQSSSASIRHFLHQQQQQSHP